MFNLVWTTLWCLHGGKEVGNGTLQVILIWLVPTLCGSVSARLGQCLQDNNTKETNWYRVPVNPFAHLETIQCLPYDIYMTLRWRPNGHGGVSNHQPHHCLLNRLFGCRSKKTSKLRVTGICAGNSPGTGEFPAQMASNAENVSIWWRHHGKCPFWLI